ncbi:FkbM family methyltransferase [Thiobacillus denitrificans]|uniref:FkbM family methyltransferase n=1 Tax=Thiobacillus denitrificans TaxID=36861 RepID=UPI0009DB608A|nr:FkbM family methyltransferase [Thiobacillus denitrificans]
MKFAIFLLGKVRRLVEAITKTEISVKIRPRVKIQVHPRAVSDGRAMALYADLVEKFCTFKPSNIFEIGANYAQDAEYLRKRFGLADLDIYVFEPHTAIIKAVRELYNFNSYDFAISDHNGRAVFHAIDVENNEYGNSGISSLRKGLTADSRNFVDIEVEVIRMDKFIRDNQIQSVDFLKLDVEGANYEVLDGFGEELSKVKSIQVEGEYRQYWEGQKLYWDIERLLRQNNFELVYFQLSDDGVQSDSFWVQQQYIARS